MSTQKFWEALPHGDFANQGHWRPLGDNRFAALRATILVIATSGKDSRLGEIVESHPLGPNEDITIRTREIRSVTNTDTIKSGLRHAVTSRVCDQLATKVSSEIGAKIPGFNGKIASEVDAQTEQELITTAERTYEGSASHTLQETIEKEFTLTLKGAQEPRTAHLRKRYWRHTWDAYLHSYDYLELEYKKHLVWPDVRKTMKQGSSETLMLPLFRIEFFEPQANINISYDGAEELEDPYAIRVLPSPPVVTTAKPPNLSSLEDSAKLAFPVTRAEKKAALDRVRRSTVGKKKATAKKATSSRMGSRKTGRASMGAKSIKRTAMRHKAVKKTMRRPARKTFARR